MNMTLPKYSDGIKTVVQTSFGGIDKRAGARDGAVFDMLNMTSDHYPVLSSVSARAEYTDTADVIGYFDSQTEKWWTREGGEGSYRDKLAHACPILVGVYDVADMSMLVVRALDISSSQLSGGQCLFGIFVCTVADGEMVVSDPVAPVYEEEIRAVTFDRRLVVWVDSEVAAFTYNEDPETKAKSITRETLNRSYYTANGCVYHDVSMATTYIRLNTYSSVDGLQVSDTVVVECNGKSQYVKLRALSQINSEAWLLETDLVSGMDQNTWDLDSLVNGIYEGQGFAITVSRQVPRLEHACVNRDRIWGAVGNEIYCCASCDPRNWYDYDYLSVARSFYAQIPEVSHFTGIASYMGNVFFFTREDVYRMYGTTPDAFSLRSLSTWGMREDASRSFGVASGMLFYNSTAGPVCFNGDSARLIGTPLGRGSIAGGIGIGHEGKYYLADGESIFIYDTHSGTWHRESGERVVSTLVIDGRLMLFYPEGDAEYHRAEAGEVRVPVVSSVELADISEGALMGVMPMELVLLAELVSSDASLRVSLRYGDELDWDEVYSTIEGGRHIHRIRFSPKRRCDYYRLRLEGTGEWRLYTLARSYSVAASTSYGE